MGALLVVVERVHRGMVAPQFASVLGSVVGLAAVGDGSPALLLRGAAVTAGVPRPPGPGPRVGARTDLAAPDHGRYLGVLRDRGCPLHVVREDCERLGLPVDRLMPGIEPLDAAGVVALVESARRVWFL